MNHRLPSLPLLFTLALATPALAQEPSPDEASRRARARVKHLEQRVSKLEERLREIEILLSAQADRPRETKEAAPAKTLQREPAKTQEREPKLTLVAQANHGRNPSLLAWDPEGARLASGSSDKDLRVWDPQGQMLTSFAQAGSPHSIAWGPKGEFLLSSTSHPNPKGPEELVIWDTERSKVHRRRNIYGTYAIAQFTAKTDTVLFSRVTGLHAIDASDLRSSKGPIQRKAGSHGKIKPEGLPLKDVERMAWSPERDRLLILTLYHIEIWDRGLTKRLHRLDVAGEQLNYAAWGPKGEKVVGVNKSGTIQTWSLERGTVLAEVSIPQAKVAEFSPDGRWLAVGAPKQVLLYESASTKLVTKWAYPGSGRGLVTSLAWRPGANLLAVGGFGGKIALVEVEDPQATQER